MGDNKNSRQKLFDKFLSGGFGDLNFFEPHDKHHFKFYKKNILPLIPKSKKSEILEIGFGMGQFLRFLSKNGYTNITGVEVSKEMYTYVRQDNTIYGKMNLKLVSDLEVYLKSNAGKFDCVVMNDVIEHLDKPRIIPILELIKNSLKPNGSLIIKTNNVASATGARMRFEDFTHETSFTPYSLRQVLRVAGYKDVAIYPYLIPITGLFRLIRVMIQAIWHLIWRLVYWFEYTTVPPVVHEFMLGVGTVPGGRTSGKSKI